MKWSVKVEKLTFEYEFALIHEGYPRKLAMKLTAELMLRLCLKLATSDLVILILWSSKFNDAKEVIDKFLSATVNDSNNVNESDSLKSIRNIKCRNSNKDDQMSYHKESSVNNKRRKRKPKVEPN